MSAPFIEVDGLEKTYKVRRGLFGPARALRAVDRISFSVDEGTTFGLVGESGSGKTTIAKLIMGAEKPSGGRIRVGGKNLAELDRPAEIRFRRLLQPVLQDPYSSLSPRLRIRGIIDEPIRIHRTLTGAKAIERRVSELLELVGLTPAFAGRFPHELSGGQRQRVAIARALSLQPKCLVLDEPVSALDVSIQAQILNLLKDLQARLRLTYVLISHDLAVVAHMSAQIGVLYLGQFMEFGPRDAIIRDARHPYTRALIAAASPDQAVSSGGGPGVVRGEIPSPLDPPSGCPFHPRCPRAEPRCAEEKPALRKLSSGHWAACHFA